MKEFSKQIHEACRDILVKIGCHEAQTRQKPLGMTAYQLSSELERQKHPIRLTLRDKCGGDYVGKGAGSHVGPAQMIAQVLGHCSDIETQYLVTRDLLIDGNTPSGRDCGIFRLR